MNGVYALEVNDFLNKYSEEELLPIMSKSLSRHVKGQPQMLETAFQAACLADNDNCPSYIRIKYEEVLEDCLELVELRNDGLAAFCETVDPKFL